MALNFGSLPLNNWWNNIGYVPGGSPLKAALGYYQRDLRGDQEGQLAAGRAGDVPGGQDGPYAPAGTGQTGALGVYGGLADTARKALSTGLSAGSAAKQSDITGALSTTSAITDSIIGQLQAQIALRNAQAAKSAQDFQSISDIMGFLTGKPSQMAFNAAFTPNTPTSGNMPPPPSGYTPTGPSNSFSSGSLPPWINPSDVSAYSPYAQSPSESAIGNLLQTYGIDPSSFTYYGVNGG